MDNNNSVIAINLARLRANRGFSQEELAKGARISRVALGKIERGLVVPRAKTLSELAEALEVPLRELVSDVELVSNVRFRAGKRINTREQILAEISSWLHSYNWLESEVGSHNPFKLAELVEERADPKKLALEARRVLKLRRDEPVRDICGLLEEKGVKVLLLKKATDAFFGLSVGPKDEGPAVVVNTWDRISVERWIFTAVHELGHILLHKEAFKRSRTDEDDAEEREADQFASHFLMPEPGFDAEWEQSRGLSLLNRVLKVKRIYRVSYKTVLYRLVESEREDSKIWGIFQAQHRNRFGKTLRKADEPSGLQNSEFRRNWSRAGEPDGLSESDFLQDYLHRLVRQALDQDLITLSRAAEILRISRADMRELAMSWVG